VLQLRHLVLKHRRNAATNAIIWSCSVAMLAQPKHRSVRLASASTAASHGGAANSEQHGANQGLWGHLANANHEVSERRLIIMRVGVNHRGATHATSSLYNRDGRHNGVGATTEMRFNFGFLLY